jgi:hypothetical protein
LIIAGSCAVKSPAGLLDFGQPFLLIIVHG